MKPKVSCRIGHAHREMHKTFLLQLLPMQKVEIMKLSSAMRTGSKVNLSHQYVFNDSVSTLRDRVPRYWAAFFLRTFTIFLDQYIIHTDVVVMARATGAGEYSCVVIGSTKSLQVLQLLILWHVFHLFINHLLIPFHSPFLISIVPFAVYMYYSLKTHHWLNRCWFH